MDHDDLGFESGVWMEVERHLLDSWVREHEVCDDRPEDDDASRTNSSAWHVR